ncbi:TonB family protein [Roseibium sp. SCPC15]|uniref:energy transducer TonB n=1 Tax=Roseibium sp. SCP15 TaxID=3141376 RepID=UPI00333E1081
MRFLRFFIAGVLISVLAHGAGSAYFAENPDEVSVAASQGGGVSVIGSIEDLVLGSRVQEVEPAEPVEELEPETEMVEEVHEPVKVARVEPPVTTSAVTPVEVETAKPVVNEVTAPVIAGVTSTDVVTAVEIQEEVKPEETQVGTAQTKPVEKIDLEVSPAKPVVPEMVASQVPVSEPLKSEPVKEQKPIEIAKAVQPELTELQKPVEPEAETLEEVSEPLQEVTKTPLKKPEPPKRKVEKVEKKKPVKQAKRRGAEVSSRKGGERITSKTARSNANGRADARTNDGGTKARSNYKGKVQVKLRRAKNRAAKKRRRGQSGVVSISFLISRNGGVSNVRLIKTSGHSNLDNAVIRLVSSMRMPKFPNDIKENSLRMRVPFSFE